MKLLLSATILIISSFAFGQKKDLIDFDKLEDEYVFESLEEALSNPEEVIRLDLSKKKIASLDYDFRKFTNLQWLSLSKNEFTAFPKVITELHKLQYIDLSKNDIDNIPDEIANLQNLREIIMYKNRLYYVSPELGKCTKIEKLDLWDNPIKSFPDELRGMVNLQILDLRVTVINEKEQKKLQKMFPNTDIKFSKTCNCN